MEQRKLTYGQAIREGLYQALEADSMVFAIGQGLWSPWYVGNSMQDLDKSFGKDRIIDSPVSENGITGIAIGAALGGMRPIVIHPRMDFMLLAIDQIVNEAANWHYIFGGESNVPIVIRSIINRGGEQGAQHSQALYSWFMHIPGLKVVAPSTAYDAKGLMLASIADNNPVIYVDDRWLYDHSAVVPQEPYEIPIGKANIDFQGSDVTLVGISYMAQESREAAKALREDSISVEVIDLRSLSPLDTTTILRSVKKTGRLIIADGAWATCGASAEIAAVVAQQGFQYLKSPIERITLPECPAPTSKNLEDAYYPDKADIVSAIRKLLLS
tara:strand:+ start:3756 stop:4739 length:984 start_codon:yes stop_codon:yes gene_type:complete